MTDEEDKKKYDAYQIPGVDDATFQRDKSETIKIKVTPSKKTRETTPIKSKREIIPSKNTPSTWNIVGLLLILISSVQIILVSLSIDYCSICQNVILNFVILFVGFILYFNMEKPSISKYQKIIGWKN